MATEAPFNVETATQKWQKKIDKGLDVNLFSIAQDIMHIQLGLKWQTNSLELDGEGFDTYSLHYDRNVPGHEQIHISAVYEDQREENFLLSRRVSPKGRNRYTTYVLIPAQYYRTPGGIKLTEEHYVKTFLDRDPTQTMVNRLWYAHLYTLDQQKHQPLEHLKIGKLQDNIFN